MITYLLFIALLALWVVTAKYAIEVFREIKDDGNADEFTYLMLIILLIPIIGSIAMILAFQLPENEDF